MTYDNTCNERTVAPGGCHSLKMQAIGRLAGGIAHDFNNILTTILGNAELLQMDGFPQSERDDMLAQILDASRRATDLNSQLLKFARNGVPGQQEIDVADVIGRSAALLRHGIDKRIEIKLDMQADQSVVTTDPWRLQSALMNLGLNACDAMDHGGVLTLGTRNAESDHEPSKQCVEISICGVGRQVDEENGNHNHEPRPGISPSESDAIYDCIRSLYGNIRNEIRPEQLTTAFALLLPTV